MSEAIVGGTPRSGRRLHSPRLKLQSAIDTVDGKIAGVGDHRQISSVDVGGGHYALTQRLGASVLGHDHRLHDPTYRDAAELLGDQQPTAAVEVLRGQGASPTPTRHPWMRGRRWSTTG